MKIKFLMSASVVASLEMDVSEECIHFTNSSVTPAPVASLVVTSEDIPMDKDLLIKICHAHVCRLLAADIERCLLEAKEKGGMFLPRPDPDEIPS